MTETNAAEWMVENINGEKPINDDVQKKPGPKPKNPNEQTKIVLSEIDRSTGLPPVIIQGKGRRNDVKIVNVPIPIEIHDRLKSCGSITPAIVALVKYALNKLDKENKILMVIHKKE